MTGYPPIAYPRTAYAASFVRDAGGADEPVTVAEAKAQMNVRHSKHDTHIEGLISAVRAAVERHHALALRPQTVTAVYRGGYASALELPVGPVRSVISVTRTDDYGDGEDAYEGADLRVVDRAVTLLSGRALAHGGDTVTAVYEAGFGDAPSDVPAEVRHAVKVWVADLYTQRTSFDAGSLAVAVFPRSIDALLDDYRRPSV